MPMPAHYVDRIFTRLMVRYGSEWLRKWEGVPEDAVKADWADQLDGFERRPDCIRYALEHLPERAPSVTEFRAICNRMSEPAAPRLEAPKADPARVAREVAKMQAAKDAIRQAKDWAYRLQASERAGERLSKAQRDMWRAALRAENEQGAACG